MDAWAKRLVVTFYCHYAYNLGFLTPKKPFLNALSCLCFVFATMPFSALELDDSETKKDNRNTS